MPTGYTADVGYGKCQSFEQFVWHCARAFGALIMMRDDPWDAPIPEEFKPSDYNAKKLVEIADELGVIEAMTDEEAAAFFEKEHAELLAKYEGWDRDKDEKRARYESMLEKVRAWTPPSADHAPLKSFMLEQLGTSIDHDCTHYERTEKIPTRASRVAQLRKDRAYHQEEDRKERERVAGRNAWLKALRASVPPSPAAGAP
jgi:hypothetical protein